MKLMGILNVTPDSFYDGGKWFTTQSAIDRGKWMFENGATIVDVGGESTRPGAQAVSLEEELRRTIPVVGALAPHGLVSIDTSKPDVARAAVASGAKIINDVSCTLQAVASEADVIYIAMHMQGTPKTMQNHPQYTDVTQDVFDYLADAAERARSAGVSECWIDPGIGFGKTFEQNVALIRAVAKFRELAPVVLGLSRKSMIGTITGSGAAAERLSGSLAGAFIAAELGVDVLRVHDVPETRDVLRVRRVLMGEESNPARS